MDRSGAYAMRWVAKNGKLPVPNFSAGGIATPADAAMMMQLGAEAIFVGSGIFMKDGTTALDLSVPSERAEAEARAVELETTLQHIEQRIERNSDPIQQLYEEEKKIRHLEGDIRRQVAFLRSPALCRTCPPVAKTVRRTRWAATRPSARTSA